MRQGILLLALVCLVRFANMVSACIHLSPYLPHMVHERVLAGRCIFACAFNPAEKFCLLCGCTSSVPFQPSRALHMLSRQAEQS